MGFVVWLVCCAAFAFDFLLARHVFGFSEVVSAALGVVGVVSLAIIYAERDVAKREKDR